MKTITGLQVAFSSLTLAFCMIVFGGNVVAQTLPSATELLARAKAKSHPRSIDVAALKSGIDWDGRWILVKSKVDQQYLETTLPVEPLAEKAMAVVSNESNKIMYAAALWLRTGDVKALGEAKRRALNLALWSPSGTTGYLSNDQAGRAMANTLALAYDWLYGQWTPTEKTKLLAAIRPRVANILATGTYGLNNGLSLDAWPYDSHKQTAAGFVAVTCAMLAGQELLYDQCVVDILPRYLSEATVWGENDGGFSQGTNYAQWAFVGTSFLNWQFLQQAVGVNMFETSWAKGYANYIAYFLPPGTPSGLFGDGTEAKDTAYWATQAKAYAGYLPSPLANWYAKNQSGANPAILGLLLAPQQNMSLISTALPSGTPHGIHIPSIGWTAMHSDLGKLSRTSVYFKSSPYGSYSHSHADQNSFVINSGGQRLAIDSGYYDSWTSPHRNGWYTNTKAHNAITYDGGVGQTISSLDSEGKITQFEHTPGYDLVTGDASLAYGGGLTKAVRSMVYLRPNTLVIFDSLESKTPRTWEWNIHALSKMGTLAGSVRHFLIDQAGVKLCVRMFVAPDGNVALSQTDQFTEAPQGTYPNQWHGRFSSLVKSTTTRFVTVLEVGCSWIPVHVERTGDSHYVTVLGNTFGFDGNKVTVK